MRRTKTMKLKTGKMKKNNLKNQRNGVLECLREKKNV